MDLHPVIPDLWLLAFEVGNAYLWLDAQDVTVIDAGPRGSAAAILQAVEDTAGRDAVVRRIVLTHFHEDHTGSAADLAARTDAEVVAGRADVSYIEAGSPGPVPLLTERERPLYERVRSAVQPAPGCRVDRPVDDGDLLPLGGGAVVVATPGHTPGSIAVHLPSRRVLFTGDTLAASNGAVILGPFDLDRAAALASSRRLAELPVEVACFGHGSPILDGAQAALRAATDPLG